jgi:tetratricopeptide (TPR) repeat protein
MSAKSEQNISTVVSSIQKIFLYLFIAILPISILSFPWDLTEKSMTIVILFFTLLICGLEIVKIIWSGKVLFLKREIDLILFLLLISLVLTTIFAQDTNLSLFGFDYRLSGGLIGLSSILLLTFVVRSFLSSRRDLINLLNAFLIGSILTSLLSVISLFGANIFDIVPKIGLSGKEGLPTLGKPIILVIYNCISVFLGYISLHLHQNDEKLDTRWFSIVAIFFNIVTLTMFSADSKAFLGSMTFTIVWILALVAIFVKSKKEKWPSKLKQSVIPLVVLLLISLMQIDAIQSSVLSGNTVLAPLNLTLDASWNVVAQSLMRSLKNGIVGLGLDSFGVIFAAFKPAEWVNINVVNSFNEVLTNLSAGGFLWFVIWLLLGWYILKDLIGDLRKYSKESKVLVLFDSLLLFIYLTSFLTTYTVLLRLVFFLMISVSIILRNLYKQQEVDNMLLKMWTMGTGKRETEGFPVMSVFFTAVISLLVILGIWRLGKITLSSLYLLRAESYISKENERLGDQEPTKEEEREITNNLYRWYKKALEYDKGNPLANRKASVVAVDKLGVLMNQYEDEADEDALNEAVGLRSEAFEYSRTAINLSPSVYAGYNNRALVYLGIINLGYTEYVRDAISVIDEAIEMKPLDYQNYYNKAQLYYLLQNYELALQASTQALSIKGDYIPALVISANINGAQGKTEIQISYLEAAKTILETNNLQDIPLYEDVIEQIEELEESNQDTEEAEEETTENNVDVPEIEQ